MAIYRTLKWADVTVGSGGRLTIPFAMRRDCGIRDGDKMTVRMDADSAGGRKLVLWRNDRDEDD